MPTSTIQDHISKFFDFSEPNEGDDFSPLNLLMRQKELCLVDGRVAVWPGVMTILSGIDMLGYYYKDGGLLDNPRQRFVDFYNEFFPPQGNSLDYGNALYNARCAMMHTFGLYTELRNGTKIKFVYSWDNPSNDFISLISSSSGEESYHVNFTHLNKLFENAVIKYHQRLVDELINPACDIVKNFEEVYNKIGLIYNPFSSTTISGSAIPGSAIGNP